MVVDGLWLFKCPLLNVGVYGSWLVGWLCLLVGFACWVFDRLVGFKQKTNKTQPTKTNKTKPTKTNKTKPTKTNKTKPKLTNPTKTNKTKPKPTKSNQN